jgi:hypothetical protein
MLCRTVFPFVTVGLSNAPDSSLPLFLNLYDASRIALMLVICRPSDYLVLVEYLASKQAY